MADDTMTLARLLASGGVQNALAQGNESAPADPRRWLSMNPPIRENLPSWLADYLAEASKYAPMAVPAMRAPVMRGGLAPQDFPLASRIERSLNAREATNPSNDRGITGGEPNQQRWSETFNEGPLAPLEYWRSSHELAARDGMKPNALADPLALRRQLSWRPANER